MKLKSEIRNPKSETIFKYFNFGNFKFVSNFVLSASCLLVLAAPLTLFAQGFVPLAEIPGLTQGATADTAGLANFFNNLYKFAIGMASVLAIIMIIWGGLQYATQDIPGAKQEGKDRILQAILGLILVLSPALVFSIINPSILNLSINLKPLDTKSGPPTGGGGTTTQAPTTGAETTAATAAGCTVTGTLLKTAACPTKKAAQDFSTTCTTGSGNVPFFTTANKATCGTEKGSITGPYSFADTSTGILATITGYSSYSPLASTPTNPNNGSSVINFASACTADGGTTCLSTVKLPCSSSVVQIITTGSLPTASCWNISLSCTDGKTGAGGCSSNPQFTVVQTK